MEHPPADLAPRPRARILFLADTHLGLDLPAHPRVTRRRRGDDFFANFDRALAPAREGRVDLVVHGGDVFYRSRIPPDLVTRAFAPLAAVADLGVPVYVVPGNHERSAIPFPLLAAHPRIHVFRTPRTYTLALPGLTLALAGFPFVRGAIREGFASVVEQTGWRDPPADVRLLCMHQAVEGARVGPVDFTFRDGDDVVRTRDIPQGFAAVLSGHIHRAQRLSTDLAGRALHTHVLYPGSIERTSFAERDEAKGFLLVEVAASGRPGGEVVGARFRKLPARPMRDVQVRVQGLALDAIRRGISVALASLDPDSVVRLTLEGAAQPGARGGVTAALVRDLAPPTMNVELAAEGSARGSCNPGLTMASSRRTEARVDDDLERFGAA
ncbi:MAG: metallophosphoesterase [Deltaproteobacteria bacterium]